MDSQLASMLTHSLGDGLNGAALVDRNGKVIAIAGAIAEEEAMPLAALVMYRLKSGDLASRMFAGEIISLTLDERDVAVSVARRQLFVVAVLNDGAPRTMERARELRDGVARMLADSSPFVPHSNRGSGGSGSGPAELSLVEYGLTVSRTRGKA